MIDCMCGKIEDTLLLVLAVTEKNCQLICFWFSPVKQNYS